jgi:P4 family phage/plasmid primase-like protien
MSSLIEAPPVVGEANPNPLPTPKRAVSSHHAYAARTLEHLAVKGWKPVFHHGQLFLLDEATAIWRPFDREELLRTVAQLNDGKRYCIRRTDYQGIADQAQSIASDATFFDEAPIGIACPDSFYRVRGDSTLIEPLGAHHRQRVMLSFEPKDARSPLFEKFLHETFRSDTEGEEQQQCRLVQEVAGAVMLGTMPRFQKAVLFYDPFGRAGKGTLERIIRQLVPEQFTTAVSPFKWDKEYYVANLVGSRLNVVGELPDGDSIPSANFKSVLGGDLLAGRQPMKSVVTFRNEAAHIFTSNHLIATRDHSEAFFSRWLLFQFPNSLLVTGQQIDTGLGDRIISQEMPAIAHWALQGGLRLLKQGQFSGSIAHDSLMQKWRRSSSSLDEFIYECCTLSPELSERRSSFYRAYATWCNENGRKPYAKGKAKEQMEHRPGLRVRFVLLDGHETIRGLSLLEAVKDALTSM